MAFSRSILGGSDDADRAPCILPTNMTVGNRREFDIGSRKVLDCAFIRDSHIVLTCETDGIKLLDKHFNVKSQLPDYSIRVATINEDEVVVTQGHMKQVQIISIFPNMVVKKTLKMDRRCYGIDVFNNEIYVTCSDHPGNGEIRVLSMDGVLQRQFNGGQYALSGPNCLKIKRDGSCLFVSDWKTCKITCFSINGHGLYRFSDDALKNPVGIFVDDEGTVLVCGERSNNIHLIENDGRRQRILLSQTDGLRYPRMVSYNAEDKCLLIGLYDISKPLLVFQIN